ncbi:hypothetical protein [Xenorhabdus bovienii]|uniref:hypothetical protein n=1 Tax=Xenorhabdus bovienii TaxID=40576 RepID=UPI0023B29722|nr:hypothetical protein [Xenorhabdus bovienii]MDE9456163.1 hypothetical protein [Xenorhabdus bovienii]MDE9553820.1 hypothetical protein [Xenorhabdus bovienii]
MSKITLKHAITRYTPSLTIDVDENFSARAQCRIRTNPEGEMFNLKDLRCVDELVKFETACERIGDWLSAALEDPNVCAEFKNDIEHWFEHKPF